MKRPLPFSQVFLTIFGHFEMLFLTGSCLGDTRPWLLTPPSALDDMHFCSGKALGAFQVVHFFATSTFNGGARESSFQKGSSFLTSFLSQNDSQIKHIFGNLRSWIFNELINHLLRSNLLEPFCFIRNYFGTFANSWPIFNQIQNFCTVFENYLKMSHFTTFHYIPIHFKAKCEENLFLA